MNWSARLRRARRHVNPDRFQVTLTADQLAYVMDCIREADMADRIIADLEQHLREVTH